MDQPPGVPPTSEPEVQVGMDVIDVDGQPVGEVLAVREDGVLVRRRTAADVLVARDAVDDVTPASVRLGVPADRVGEVGRPGTTPA